MTKLNQIIAVTKAVTSSKHAEFTAVHHETQKTQTNGPLHGISRTYEPDQDDGERLPSESTRVQVRIDDLIDRATKALTRLFDVTATRDLANCHARADIVVDGETVVGDVPATYLLWLEKRLVDIHTFVAKLPTLDPAETWHHDPARGCWATDPIYTVRTRKVQKGLVLYEATKEHPAQVQPYADDVRAGTWTTIKLSGALPADRVRELVERVEKLQEAVKVAREEANSIEVTDVRVGDKIFGYLFA